MRNWKTFSCIALVGVCALLVCGAAFAQRGGGGPQLSPEVQAKVTEMQAKAVAQDLKLTPEQTTKLTAAYKAQRESMAAARAKMGPDADRTAMMQAMMAERTKFETAVKDLKLTPEQTARIMSTLGSMNRRWDAMVVALDSMKLDEKKMAEAMKLVTDYVAESGKIMEAAMASGDFQGVREKVAPLKEKLDTELGKVLSPEQLTKWKEETAPRGGGGR